MSAAGKEVTEDGKASTSRESPDECKVSVKIPRLNLRKAGGANKRALFKMQNRGISSQVLAPSMCEDIAPEAEIVVALSSRGERKSEESPSDFDVLVPGLADARRKAERKFTNSQVSLDNDEEISDMLKLAEDEEIVYEEE